MHETSAQGGHSMPSISVILPIYNAAKHLKQSIDSVLDQTYTDWEILAINEFGSDDGSGEIVKEYAEKDKRIILVQNDVRLGLADSLNKGFKMATGKYLARLDADDIAHPTRFQKQVDFLESHLKVGIVGTYQHHFGKNTNWVHTPPVEPEQIRAKLLFNCDMCHSTLMLRRDVVMKNSLYYDNHYLAEDYELWCRAVLLTDFATIPEILGEYRWGGDNISIGKKEKLNIESGHLVAKNLELALSLKLPEVSHRYFQNWENPFDDFSSEERNRQLGEFEEILKLIYSANKEKQYISDNDMLSLLASKWRWAKYFMPWNDHYDICCLDEIFNESYKPSLWVRYRRFCETNKKISTRLKKIAKRLLRPIIRPFKRSFDGRFESLESNVCALIEAKTRELNSNMQESLFTSFESINEFYKIEMGKIENRIDRALDERICRAEEKITANVDGRIWKAEEKITANVDGRIWKAEEKITADVDGRIWKSENVTAENIDNRIRRSEGLLVGFIKDESEMYLFSEGEVHRHIDLIYRDLTATLERINPNFQREEGLNVNDQIIYRGTEAGGSDLYKFLLVNDTFNTFHCGCSGTSIAIRNYLERYNCGKKIADISWDDISKPTWITPESFEDFNSQEFFLKWKESNRLILAKMESSEWVVVNGEGSLSNYNAGTLNLLYLVYIASKTFQKKTAIINHSVCIENGIEIMSQDKEYDYVKILKLVYESLTFCAVREPVSLYQLKNLITNRVVLSAACLSIYIEELHCDKRENEKKFITISGGNFLDQEYVHIVQVILDSLEERTRGLQVVFLYCDIPSASETMDLEIFARLEEHLGKDKISLLTVTSTDQWLKVIQDSAFLLSGRFHHTIAAFMLDTPFLVCKSDTGKVEGLLEMVQKKECLINYRDVDFQEIHVKDLLQNNAFYKPNDKNLKDRLVELARENFRFINEDTSDRDAKGT